jgi:hypothetical protein
MRRRDLEVVRLLPVTGFRLPGIDAAFPVTATGNWQPAFEIKLKT